ncbi:hypothetical protein ACP70R_027963 [Stipagrostis hirtigluma subsp. patula]
MRSSNLSLAATAVFFLVMLMSMEVQGIRLDAESRAAVTVSQQTQQMVNKSSENLPKPATSGEPLSEVKRSIAAKEVRATAHKLPEFHEDYYGASVHEPRHH